VKLSSLVGIICAAIVAIVLGIAACIEMRTCTEATNRGGLPLRRLR